MDRARDISGWGVEENAPIRRKLHAKVLRRIDSLNTTEPKTAIPIKITALVAEGLNPVINR
jgi:hypothetical protein